MWAIKSIPRLVRGAGNVETATWTTVICDRIAQRTSLLRNSGIPLDLNWVQEVRVNTSAVERRTQSQVARRTVKKEWQAAWLLRAITCMDLTTLSGRRYRRASAPALRQGRAAAAGTSGRLGIQHSESRCRHLRLSHVRRDGGPGAGRQRHSGRGGLHRLSRRAVAAATRSRDRALRRGRRAGNRHRHTRAHVLDRQLAGALRRDAASARPAATRT